MASSSIPEAGRSPVRGAAREQAILDAAVELIAELGYERITVDAIAARAHASKSTMYRRWPGGKPELVAAALSRRAQGDVPIVPDTGSLRGDLIHTADQIAQTLTGSVGPSLIGLLEAIRDDPTLRKLIASQVRERGHEVGRIICGRATARGEAIISARSDDVMDIAFAQILTETLFQGGIPQPSAQQHMVDGILLPLLHGETDGGGRALASSRR